MFSFLIYESVLSLYTQQTHLVVNEYETKPEYFKHRDEIQINTNVSELN